MKITLRQTIVSFGILFLLAHIVVSSIFIFQIKRSLVIEIENEKGDIVDKVTLRNVVITLAEEYLKAKNTAGTTLPSQ